MKTTSYPFTLLMLFSFTLLLLTACAGVEDFDYRKKGEPATLARLIGVWDRSPQETPDSATLDYVVVREDSTYTRATFHRQPDSEGRVDCFSVRESTITDIGNGRFLIGQNEYDIFIYKDKIGYYFLGNIVASETANLEYKRIAESEANIDFTPVCVG